ncbi:MAG TPA: NADP-dependent oxidoreductase [Devosiaceae bacterium]|nr:NADP-dependent oxidoreductase [Devosiaceae bacterium]
MEAIRIHKFGGPDVLEVDDVEKPVAGSGELLVQVMAASVSPVDYKIRGGGYDDAGQALPITLGRDLAGVVEEVGLDVDGFAIDNDVFALLGRDRGAYAQYVIVTPDEVARMPPSLSYVEAAAVPLAGLTAWQGLFDHGDLQSGQRVLIHGGAGGVGHLAVQFAKARGAFVATTASSEDIAFLSEIGADQVIDYQRQRFEEESSDFDLVYDLIGGETQDRSWGVLKRGGALITTLKEPSREEAQRRQLRAAHYMTVPNSTELAEIAGLIQSGRVKVRVQSVYPLSEAGQAQSALERGHVQGKIVLKSEQPAGTI